MSTMKRVALLVPLLLVLACQQSAGEGQTEVTLTWQSRVADSARDYLIARVLPELPRCTNGGRTIEFDESGLVFDRVVAEIEKFRQIDSTLNYTVRRFSDGRSVRNPPTLQCWTPADEPPQVPPSPVVP